MKKALKIFSISIFSIFLMLLVMPFAFKGKIKTKIQSEINKSINAKVSFGKIGLSLIRNFPDMTLRISDLKIVGVQEFATDTLADISKLSCTIDLMSVLKGNEYKIKQITASDLAIYLKVLASGKANWDITKPSEDTVSQAATSSFKAMLDKIELTDARITYDDAELPALLIFKGINGVLGGDMTIDITRLQIDADIDEVTTDYDGVRYLSKVKAKLSTMLDADLANWKFTFAKGSLKLNDLELLADGYFAMPDSGYNMDIKFAASQNTFKSFLSLVPGIYSNEFKDLKSNGTLSLDGYVRGWYTDVSIPAFALNVNVDNGSFAYPTLPGSVDKIMLKAHVTNPDGVMDHTEIVVNQLHFSMMNNPVDVTLKALTPVSDPYIDATIKGRLNLSDVQKVYPLENTKIAGEVLADMSFKGNISAIERSAYDKFYASGYASVSQLVYEGEEVSKPVRINAGRLDFDPAAAKLSDLSINIGNSDMKAEGRLENYIPYLMKKNAVLKGALSIRSDNLDVNNMLATSEESNNDTSGSTSVVNIPPNIEFALNASINHLKYDTYNLSDVKGTINVANQQLLLHGLQAGVLGGNVILNGTYSTFSGEQPKVDMDLQVNKIELKEAIALSEMVQKYIPLASKLNGAVNTKLKLKGRLKNDMMPELTTISAYGLLLSDVIGIKDINTFNRISDALKIDKLRNPSLQKVNLSFDILDGKATVKPMDFKLGGYNANFSGTTSLDQTLNFILNLEIPRSDFGAKANGVLNKMVTEASGKGVNIKLGDIVPVTILIGGTASDPKITTGIKNAMSNLVEDIKNQAVAQIEKKKEELVAKAKQEATSLITKADAEAAKLIAEAEKQSQKIIQAAAATAQKVRFVADSTASRVVAEGKKNGYIAEIAAKKTAEKVKKEGYDKAVRIETEATKQSNAVLEHARAEAEKLKKEALDRVK